MLKSIFEGITNLFSDEEHTNGSSTPSVPSWAPEINESPRIAPQHRAQESYETYSTPAAERTVTGPVTLDPTTAARLITELEREIAEGRKQRANLEAELTDLRSRLSQIERMVKF